MFWQFGDLLQLHADQKSIIQFLENFLSYCHEQYLIKSHHLKHYKKNDSDNNDEDSNYDYEDEVNICSEIFKFIEHPYFKRINKNLSSQRLAKFYILSK